MSSASAAISRALQSSSRPRILRHTAVSNTPAAPPAAASGLAGSVRATVQIRAFATHPLASSSWRPLRRCRPRRAPSLPRSTRGSPAPRLRRRPTGPSRATGTSSVSATRYLFMGAHAFNANLSGWDTKGGDDAARVSQRREPRRRRGRLRREQGDRPRGRCVRASRYAPSCARTKGTGEAETLPSEMCCFCGGAIA